MKTIILGLALVGLVGIANADESVGEKAKATTNDAARSVKKGANRIEEAVCAESDTKCLAEKAKNRASETKDYTKDKASELKNAVDNDK